MFSLKAWEPFRAIRRRDDASKAKAELQNGELKVTLPMSAQSKAREVKVAVA